MSFWCTSSFICCCCGRHPTCSRDDQYSRLAKTLCFQKGNGSDPLVAMRCLLHVPKRPPKLILVLGSSKKRREDKGHSTGPFPFLRAVADLGEASNKSLLALEIRARGPPWWENTRRSSVARANPPHKRNSIPSRRRTFRSGGILRDFQWKRQQGRFGKWTYKRRRRSWRLCLAGDGTQLR